ncbi:polysaccharide biosynthesis/export family protein [soil metagenome]
MRRGVILASFITVSALSISACAPIPRTALSLNPMSFRDTAPQPGFPDIGYATWTDDEPQYRFYQGDEIEVVIPSAPENNKTVTVQPDGRIALPLIGQVMAADRNVDQLEYAITQAYSTQLLRPLARVTPKAGPIKVFVGGEVGNPGVYEMVGDGDALRAIIQAGGFKPSAQPGKVMIVRRGVDGRAMSRSANFTTGLKSPSRADFVPLRRMDVVYVPRSGVAQVGLFMQQYLRDALPFQFSYAINGRSLTN